MYRKTYAQVNLDVIESNITNLVNNNVKYDYYIGVAKANGYGHTDEIIKSFIKSGINYIAVSSLEEALNIRKYNPSIPILSLEPIDIDYISIATENNITITVHDYEYFTLLLENNISAKAHLKIDTGMNRLGIKSVNEIIDILENKQSIIFFEGIYSHMATADTNDLFYCNQEQKFNSIMEQIDTSKIKIIHLGNSASFINYEKSKYVNGIRLGIAIYGINPASKKINYLKPAFSLYSRIMQIKNVCKNEKIGYNGLYEASKDMIIGIVPIGYADGVIRANEGREVYIKGNYYKIVGHICMDMLMVELNKDIKVGELVELIGEHISVEKISQHVGTIPYEIICSINDRVPRLLIQNNTIKNEYNARFNV